MIRLAKQLPCTVTRLAAIAEAKGLPRKFLPKDFEALTQYARVATVDYLEPLPSIEGCLENAARGRDAAPLFISHP